MNVEIELRTAQKELDVLLAKKVMSATEKKQADILLSKVSQLRDHQLRQARVASLAKEAGLPVAVAENGGSDFRTKFLSEQFRTYAALSESTGAALIPSAFEVKLKSLMIADGPLFAGSPLLTNIYAKAMQPGKVAVSDDLAQPGIIASENTALTDDAELTGLSGVSIGGNSNRYSTGILLASVGLAEDQAAAATMEDLIAKAASARLSRIQNSTNLAALKTALALNSSAAVAASGGSIADNDVYTLISAVGAAYRGTACFIMSKAKQSALGALKSTSGKRLFPHVLDAKPTLVGYDVYIISAAATDDILFGDFSYIFTKSTPIEMRVLRERFRTQGYYGYLLSERAEAKYIVASTSDSPVKYLTF
jgi:HK97 family phage major capsid protein